MDFSEKMIILETLKQRKPGIFRAISLPDVLLNDYGKLNRNTKKLWNFSRTTGWRIVVEKMVASGITGCKASPQGLRYTFAVTYISNQVPITTLQKWLGHKHLETTAVYLNILGKDDRRLASRIW